MTGNAGTWQPQGGLKPWEQDALEAVNFGWGDAYLIGPDDERGYWAARRDRIGGLLMAADADELRRAISEDYALRPVPRETLPDSRPEGREPILGTDPGRPTDGECGAVMPGQRAATSPPALLKG